MSTFYKTRSHGVYKTRLFHVFHSMNSLNDHKAFTNFVLHKKKKDLVCKKTEEGLKNVKVAADLGKYIYNKLNNSLPVGKHQLLHRSPLL